MFLYGFLLLDEYNIGSRELEAIENDKLEKLSNILTKLLVVPWPEGESPLLYVENSGPEYSTDSNGIELPHFSLKRSKYYRKYPWKRQNNR